MQHPARVPTNRYLFGCDRGASEQARTSPPGRPAYDRGSRCSVSSYSAETTYSSCPNSDDGRIRARRRRPHRSGTGRHPAPVETVGHPHRKMDLGDRVECAGVKKDEVAPVAILYRVMFMEHVDEC